MATPKNAITVARPRGAYLAFGAAGFGLAGASVALVVTRTGLDFMSFVVLMCAAVRPHTRRRLGFV